MFLFDKIEVRQSKINHFKYIFFLYFVLNIPIVSISNHKQ